MSFILALALVLSCVPAALATGNGPMTLGQMLDGVDPDLVPSDQTMYEDLLWAFGAWDTLEQMNAAMATRVYTATPDGTVGFRLVK